MEFKTPKEVYMIHQNHKDKKIIITYDISIINDGAEQYKNNLAHIMKDIDWCIKKSYKSSTDKS